MTKTILSLAITLALTGCGTMGNNLREIADAGPQDPSVLQTELKKQIEILPPALGPVIVAVYNFRDQTGQRKSQANIASLSSAVTQGADAYLIRSLQTVGNGQWFKVVERGGLDNLIKERQLIRQMRELYEGKDARPLPPMVFAGVLLEGGIIGYDSNVMSGGSGARILGIGAQTEYRQDEVVVSVRAVSVATGEVIASVTVGKTVISFQDKLGVLRFNELGTRAVEVETGSATNESMNKAVQLAIHASVIELIFEGERKGHWQFKRPAPKVEAPKVEAPKVEAPLVKEEKKDELAQKDVAPKAEDTDATKPARAIDNDELSGSGNTTQLAKNSKSSADARASRDSTATATAAITKRTAKINADSVKIRENSISGSRILLTVKKETVVEILEKKGRVVKVSVQGKDGPIQGWISQIYLTKQKLG